MGKVLTPFAESHIADMSRTNDHAYYEFNANMDFDPNYQDDLYGDPTFDANYMATEATEMEAHEIDPSSSR